VGIGNGTFDLTYAQPSTPPAALSRVQNNFDEMWIGRVGGGLNLGLGFIIDGAGSTAHKQSADGGVFNGCVVASGGVVPVSNVNVYTVTITLSNCNDTSVDGTYTGLASTRSQTDMDDWLVLMVTFSDYSIHAEFTRSSTV
jgi:hypothetical protein